jgi:hypothetical protein
MKWQLATNEPIRSERTRLVRSENEEEGWVSVTWGQGGPYLFGAVYASHTDENGNSLPLTKVIDPAPEFPST